MALGPADVHEVARAPEGVDGVEHCLRVVREARGVALEGGEEGLFAPVAVEGGAFDRC